MAPISSNWILYFRPPEDKKRVICSEVCRSSTVQGPHSNPPKFYSSDCDFRWILSWICSLSLSKWDTVQNCNTLLHSYLYLRLIFWGISLLVRNWDKKWAFHRSWISLQSLIDKGLMCSSLVLCVSPCYASPARLCPTLPPPPSPSVFQISRSPFSDISGSFHNPHRSFLLIIPDSLQVISSLCAITSGTVGKILCQPFFSFSVFPSYCIPATYLHSSKFPSCFIYLHLKRFPRWPSLSQLCDVWGREQTFSPLQMQSLKFANHLT